MAWMGYKKVITTNCKGGPLWHQLLIALYPPPAKKKISGIETELTHCIC